MDKKHKLIEVQGGSSNGGYEFNVLDTPSEQEYNFVDLKSYTLGDDIYWHGYILGEEIKLKKFPLDANPRKPQPTKVVKYMQATIQKDPANFHHLNDGITIICNDVTLTSLNKAKISFGEIFNNHGDGICNGGHTYFAIEQLATTIPDNVLVRLELIVLSKKLDKAERAKKIKNIAEARNSHNELESITSAHYSGYYDPFIRYLGTSSTYFRWFEGDPNAIKTADKVDLLIAKLTSVCPHWFQHYMNSSGQQNHMSAARNPGSIHSKWQEEASRDNDKNMYYMIPLLNDILFLLDEIRFSLLHDDFSNVRKVWRKTRIWQFLADKGTEKLNFKNEEGDELEGYKLSHAFETMILGAFRENIWYGVDERGISYVGWLLDPIKLWNDHKETLIKKLDEIASSISAPSFGSSFIQNAAIYGYQLTMFELGARLEAYMCRPEIIYKVESNEKYIKVNIESEASHHLSCRSLDTGLPPEVEIKIGAISGKETLYKNV